jgi:hypothetical protein
VRLFTETSRVRTKYWEVTSVSLFADVNEANKQKGLFGLVEDRNISAAAGNQTQFTQRLFVRENENFLTLSRFRAVHNRKSIAQLKNRLSGYGSDKNFFFK